MENSKKATNFTEDSSTVCIAMKDSEKQHDKFSTPEELLEEFQYAKDIGWTVEQIKFLAKVHLVKVDEGASKLMILQESFVDILNRHKDLNKR